MSFGSPFPLITPVESARHSMGHALAKYVLPKVPVKLRDGDVVRVGWSRDVSGMMPNKTHDKIFNWRRPSFSRTGSSVQCLTVPGVDYIYHYAKLIATAAELQRAQISLTVEWPEHDAVRSFVRSTLPTLPAVDVTVLGFVHKILPASTAWSDTGIWRYSVTTIGKRSALFLGCEFSYWGDIVGETADELHQRGVSPWLIYCGKLGSLDRDMMPNTCLVTGNTSHVDGEGIVWNGRFESTISPHRLRRVNHITVPSVLDETKEWVRTARKTYDVVDPEIGRIGAMAFRSGFDFDFLHIVSDNLVKPHREGLHNERVTSVVSRRAKLFEAASSLLHDAIERG